jgi:hypothetical protein
LFVSEHILADTVRVLCGAPTAPTLRTTASSWRYTRHRRWDNPLDGWTPPYCRMIRFTLLSLMP